MPEEILDGNPADSSPADQTDVDVAGSSPAEKTDDSAASSPADGEKAEPSALDIVDRALGSEESPASEENGEAKSKEQDPKGKSEGEAELPDDPTEEELKGVNPRTRKRIEALLDQRSDLRTKLEDVEPRARQWDQIEQFRQQNGMKPEYVANAIQLAAMIENEPDRAFKIVDQIHAMLAQRVGFSLSDELTQAVKRGEITKEAAFELSRARAMQGVLSEQNKRTAAQVAEVQEHARLAELTGSLAATSTAWDKKKATSDPDWNVKRVEIAKRVENRLKAEGLPQTAEGMRQVLDEEAAAVDNLIAQFLPKGRPVSASPESASPRGAAPRQPKDHYDVVDIALGG